MFRKWIIRLALDIYRAWETERWFIKPEAIKDAATKMIKIERIDLLCDTEFVKESSTLPW
jgi:hypothetical protein